MAEKNVNDRILERVDPSRRDLVKRVLAGATFAAPFIATFSIDGLTASSAQAGVSNITNSCSTLDAGYVGPNLFQVHVSGSGTTANGEVQLLIAGPSAGVDEAPVHQFVELQTTVTMTSNTTATNIQLLVNNIQVATLVQGKGFIGPGSIHNFCDFNSLLQALAAGHCTVSMMVTFMAQTFTMVSGPFMAATSDIVKINP